MCERIHAPRRMNSTVIGVPTSQSLTFASVSFDVESHTHSHNQFGSTPHTSVTVWSTCAGIIASDMTPNVAAPSRGDDDTRPAP